MEARLKSKSQKSYLILSLLVAFVLSIFTFTSTVLAVSEEQAMNNLTTYVYGKMSTQEYTLEKGGSIKGSDLFEGSPTDGYDLIEGQFTSLSSKAQTQVVSDIATYSNEAVDSDKAKGVEESTVQTWWKQLQTKEGVGSKFMGEILKNTKPDFVTANQIYEPFSGPISIGIGVVAVLMMGFLGFVMVADIAYITLPPLRLFVDDGNGKAKSKIFSNDAIYAVQVAEEQDGGSNGNKKQALSIYFKRRIVMLILLGICLLYLVQGQLYTLVGYILDIVSGFLGF